MSEDKEKVLDKVRKLLDLATNNAASEGERDNALRMAYAMLKKHNLDMVDVEKFSKAEDRIIHNAKLLKMPWCRDIIKSMARLFFCSMYLGGRVNSERIYYVFVGKESNAVTAAVMSEYLITSILKEARKRFKQDLCPEARSFSVGAADSIYSRVNQMIKEAQSTETGGSTALTVVNLYQSEIEANKSYMESQGIKLVKAGTRGSSAVNTVNYHEGRSYGNTLNLNEQIKSSKSNTKLLT